MDFPYLVFCLYYHEIPSRDIIENLVTSFQSLRSFFWEKTYSLVITMGITALSRTDLAAEHPCIEH